MKPASAVNVEGFRDLLVRFCEASLSDSVLNTDN